MSGSGMLNMLIAMLTMVDYLPPGGNFLLGSLGLMDLLLVRTMGWRRSLH
jgi:hypothetical protein